MGVLARLTGRKAADFEPIDDFWYNGPGATAAASGRLTPDLALRISAVYACINVLAQDIAKVPLIVYRRISDDRRERATEHPLYHVLKKQPNRRHTAFGFKETMQACLGLRGKYFAQIVPGERGSVTELRYLHPDSVTVEELPNYALRYQVMGRDGIRRPYVQDEIFHVSGMSLDGVTGMSVIEYAASTLNLARTAEQHGERFFQNAAKVAGTFEHPGKLKEGGQKNLKASIKENTTGASSWDVLVLEEGMKFNPVGISPKDAQFLESREFQIPEIARWFRMQLHKIGYMKQATFSNIEHQALEYVIDTLMPWATRIEAAVNAQLLADEEYYAEFLLTSLLRGDATSRATYYRERLNTGTLSINEVRRLENENPIEGGDRHYIQGAMIPIDRVDAQLDAGARRPDPAAPAKAPPKPANDDPDARADTRLAFRILIDDAAQRIARAELAELETREKHADADRERFTAWSIDVVTERGTFTSRAIGPVAEAWAMLERRPLAIDPIAAAITQAGVNALAAASTTPLAHWRTGARRAAIASLVETALHGALTTPQETH